MKITVKLFAVAAQLAERDEVEVELGEETTIAALRTALADQVPALKNVVAQVMFAVNMEFANDASKITEDAEVACIPPVSGG